MPRRSKSDKLSSEIDIQKQTLERQQNRLAQIQQNNSVAKAQKEVVNTTNPGEGNDNQQNNTTNTSAAQQDSTEEKGEPESKKKTLDASVDGIGSGYYDIDGGGKKDYECAVSKAGEWCVVFPNNVVRGQAVCNDTRGKYAVASSSEQINSNGQNCWCKMTQPSGSRWVFRHSYSVSSCADHCANDCALNAQYGADFRGSLFGAQ